MQSPLLTIIVPVYNTEKYLERCLNSIIDQTYKELEIIVVDDCSTDSSSEIISKMSKSDSRIVTLRHKNNKGLFQARITGVSKATGKYVAFVDSDDYLSIDYYRCMVEKAEEGFDIVADTAVREETDGSQFVYTLHEIGFGSNPLYGDDVRNQFYGQEGTCYSWHTVWNKIYKKDLWDKCLPDLLLLDKHIIMTEDVAFSSIIFYYANSFCYLGSTNAYFYCVNEGASTNTQKVTYARFKKNVGDMISVFNFVSDFLDRVQANDEIKLHFSRFRSKYYWMYKNQQIELFDSALNISEAKSLLNELRGNTEIETSHTETYFESILSVWNNKIEKVKKDILSDKIKVVSFDIFDTLISRPLWNPEDIFYFMQPKFERICPELKQIEFAKFRLEAENQARAELYHNRPGYEDINLAEIYAKLTEIIGISSEQANALQQVETTLEYSLSQPRQVGKELFSFALYCKKDIILISDMYLPEDDIKSILTKNGYTGYDMLFVSSQIRLTKYTGNLFTYAAKKIGCTSNQIIHIGDNWDNDILRSQEKGYNTFFLPKSKSTFCNDVSDVSTYHCADIFCMVGNKLTHWNKLTDAIGFRSMLSLVSNKLFDNPYRSWVTGTDFSANPFIAGYYAVGMSLVGITKWITNIVKERNTKHIVFLARDGYLPEKAFCTLKSFFDVDEVESSYVPCSRQALLPWIIDDENGLYRLPIQYQSHSPLSLFKMLSCCRTETDEQHIEKILNASGLHPHKNFSSFKEYILFINLFKREFFNAEKLGEAKKLVSEYYHNTIQEDSLVFDLGYSGTILVALQKCLGYHVTFAYVHHDNNKFFENKRKNDLDVSVMYDFVPPFSDLVREYFFSECGKNCIGFEKSTGKIEPLFENENIPYSDSFSFENIAAGAEQFINIFEKTFYELRECIHVEYTHCCLPLEGMIYCSTNKDKEMLGAAFSDDPVYAGRAQIGMAQFWQINFSQWPDYAMEQINHSNIHEIAYNKNYLEKFFLYAICDRYTLKQKIKAKFKNHPVMLKIMRNMYRFARGVKRFIWR